MAATKQNIVIEQGATFKFTVTWLQSDGQTPVDLTTYSARMHIREKYDDPDPAIIELTDVNGRITLGGVAGTIQLDISATDTAALDFPCGVYDLELVNGAEVTRLMYGAVGFSYEVTR